jgi:hypothetical protein
MRLSLRGRRTVTAGMAFAIAAVGVFSSACEPAATTKVISGTIKGADGHVVDVMLGFDVLDARGNKIDMGSINAGYSAIQRLNHCVPIQGATGTGICPATTHYGQQTPAQATTYNWSLRVPSNAASVYVEVYPKEPTPNYTVSYRGYVGPMPGTTNVTEYGMTHRRAINVAFGNVSNVSIVLPVACGNGNGGTTGTMAGHINGWYGGTGSIYTWSMSSDRPTLGFGVANVDSGGNYRLAGLASGQSYKVQAQSPGGFFRTAIASGNVNRCQTKSFNF